MSQYYVVPNIYSDMSDQSQGYFAFRFTCQLCHWQIDSLPIRSSVSTVSNIMDIGGGLLGGFWGQAANAGQKIYGMQWHSEQADALQKSWAQVQHNFHTCPKCHYTVCMKCFNVQVNLCTNCAPDLKADGAQFLHEKNLEAQRKQIEESYHAPRFNVDAIPSAVTPDLVQQSAPQLPASYQQAHLPGQPVQTPTPAPIAGSNTPGYPAPVMCPKCRRMGTAGKFCQDCGTKLPLPDLICPQCSSPVAAGSRFCSECGAKLQSST